MKARSLLIVLFIATVCIIITACSSKNDIEDIEINELYRIQVGEKCGFINETGKLVIEPQFDRAYWYFSDGVCYAEIGERKGLINTDGEFVVELETSIDWVTSFRDGIAVFHTDNGKEGIINKLGEIVLPAVYNDVLRDENYGYIIVDTLVNLGYVNNQGKFIVPCKYNAINGFSEGLMVVATSNKCGYVDTMGRWVLDTIYDDARSFGDGLACVKINGRCFFIDHEGKENTKLNYDEILTGFACNRAFVKNNNLIELIDKNGTQIAVIEADSVFKFSEGYATFKKNGYYGKFDTNGQVVVQPKFENLYKTCDGLSVFEKNGKQGLIDTAGNIIIEAMHEKFLYVDESLLLLFEDDNWSRGIYYDRMGNLMWKDMSLHKFSSQENPTKEDYISFFDSRLAELDPIEGIYYVTFNRMSVNRENDHTSSNGSSSKFYAIIRTPNTDEFVAYVVDEKNPGLHWVKKFVQIGETNTYAVVNVDKESTWSEDGKLVLEDPYKFDVTLRQGGNNWYNWYVQCDFIKDYPSSAIYEQIQKAEWSGTGFAIADGYVVTNYHVINGAKSISVKGVNGDIKEAYKGYVVASDREHDLAIIRIVDKKFEGIEDIPYCIGKSFSEVGDDIFVLGYPMTNTMGHEVKLTDGIISAESGFKGDKSMYQISAAVQPGNSGGPLFDADGNVIGIVCAKHADAENANYAIKVSYLYSLINTSGLGIKMSDNNKVKSKTLSKKVKQVKPFVYLIECCSH